MLVNGGSVKLRRLLVGVLHHVQLHWRHSFLLPHRDGDEKHENGVGEEEEAGDHGEPIGPPEGQVLGDSSEVGAVHRYRDEDEKG